MRLNKIKIVVMNKLRLLFFASILLPLVSIAQEKQNNFEISKSIDIYNNVFRYLNQNYVDEINPAELNETAINAMLKELDPYTVFIPESEIDKLINVYENRIKFSPGNRPYVTLKLIENKSNDFYQKVKKNIWLWKFLRGLLLWSCN